MAEGLRLASQGWGERGRQMCKLTKRLERVRSQRGFSLVELMVGGLVLVVGLIMLSQFFASAAARVMESDIRSVLHQVANEELEDIRGLPYTDVGTTNGNPQGVLAPDEYRTADVTTVRVHRAVVYWTDASYDPTDPYPANYRRVTVTVSAVHEVDGEWETLPSVTPVELVSNIAGGATGGTLLVRVQDSQGQPVEGANFTIVNDHLVPTVNISSSEMITNELGIMLVPGLKVDDSGSYVVTATKTGYSTDSETGFAVIEGTAQEVVLTIDKVSRMIIRVVDLTGVDVPNIPLEITGPEDYTRSTASEAGGLTLEDLRFATSADPYIVTMPAGTYPKQEQSVEVPADTTVTVEFVVDTSGATTTTTNGSTTTSNSVTSTTTTGGTYGSLRVTVRDYDNHNRIKGASVQLGVWNHATGDNGRTFFGTSEFPVVGTTYSLTVTKDYYDTYIGTWTITGADEVTIYIDRNGNPGGHGH
jgi:type II secretory pathway pseudopilin PulG